MDILFDKIAPRGGSKEDSFEELCCQLASREHKGKGKFYSLHGAGGDGGIECFIKNEDETKVGWQAKYLFNIDSLLKQASKSFETAINIHPELTKYILCFPFDLTGPTGRKGSSGQEKIDVWRKQKNELAKQNGCNVTIEFWPATRIKSLLMEHDASGGIRNFFFDDQYFTDEWFRSNIESARVTAGPRYTPELNVEINISQWFEAFGKTDNWKLSLEQYIKKVNKEKNDLNEAVTRQSTVTHVPGWPSDCEADALVAIEKISEGIDKLYLLNNLIIECSYEYLHDVFQEALSILNSIENYLADKINQEFGQGRANSPGFRQFMAEYQVSFPAANLDTVRDVIKSISELINWIESPNIKLVFDSCFILSGGWGVGKTHGVCDIASRRLAKKLYSCVLFGHQFDGEPDLGSRFVEALGFSSKYSKDSLLDALNSAAEITESPLIIFIDAINETRPYKYWRERIASLINEIKKRPYLRVCFTCRTPFLKLCLPDNNYLILEHEGFKGVVREACSAYFNYYNLTPPISPILQPELANPLYLKLVCETLKSKNINTLPLGWSSTSNVINAFLEQKESEFSIDKDINKGARIVTKSLQAISHEIAELGVSKLNWTETINAVKKIRSDAESIKLVEWLIHNDLLIDEPSDESVSFPAESTVRIAFERFGDFLVATKLLDGINEDEFSAAFLEEGSLNYLVASDVSIMENHGVLSALSIIVPEKYKARELSSFLMSNENCNLIERIIVDSLSSRNPDTFSILTRNLISKLLSSNEYVFETMDCLLSIAWHKSKIDALWLHSKLESIQLSDRDSFWCNYLNWSYEEEKSVKKLIESAFELPLKKLDDDVAILWATMLLWFSAAADRRISDNSTRALIEIFCANVEIIPEMFSIFFEDVDDDKIIERLLLASYGSLVLTRSADSLYQLLTSIKGSYDLNTDKYNNALVRDHIRCIGELGRVLGVIPDNFDIEFTTIPIISDWPLSIPDKDQAKELEELIKFKPDEFHSDFYKYSMGCLKPWLHELSKVDAGRWILNRVVNDFQYKDSGCDNYDRYILANHGGGRAKPVWAERIAKKYMWTAMYQIAARLNDNVEREKTEWEPDPLRNPLILMEERKMDPTFNSSNKLKDESKYSFWMMPYLNVNEDLKLTNDEWISNKNDVPTLEALIKPVIKHNQNWRLIKGYVSWSGQTDNDNYQEPYRYMWISINSYMVKQSEAELAYAALKGKNLNSYDSPEGATYLYGFVGEYPWATSFNVDSEQWLGRDSTFNDIAFNYFPTWDKLAIEWEYDGSLDTSYHMYVPAKELFKDNNLWWNGDSGFILDNDKTVFFDPSLRKSGPSSLIVDFEYFLKRINELGYSLIWTLNGEKLVLRGSENGRNIINTFSQIALLKSDGNIDISKCSFFDSY